MSDWTFEELQEWDEKIVKIAKSHGLDWYDIAYETIDYHEMIGAMAYHGMPSHFPHWSYGKSFESLITCITWASKVSHMSSLLIQIHQLRT
jgi:stage V sporulation protein R